MNTLVNTLEQRLAPLAATVLTISDDSAQHAGHAGNTGGGHLSAKIVSNVFSGAQYGSPASRGLCAGGGLDAAHDSRAVTDGSDAR